MSLQLKNKIQVLRTEVDTASQRHTKERQKYFHLGDNCLKMKEKTDAKVLENHACKRGEPL